MTNVLINDECAKRRSICIALLLLIRDLCMKLGAVVLALVFNSAAERELPAGGSEGHISPICSIQPCQQSESTSGVTPLMGFGDELAHGPNVAGSLSCLIRKAKGRLCTTGLSTLYLRALG